MEIQFSSPVNSHYFALRCIPGDCSRQRIALTEQNIYPADYLARTRIWQHPAQRVLPGTS